MEYMKVLSNVALCKYTVYNKALGAMDMRSLRQPRHETAKELFNEMQRTGHKLNFLLPQEREVPHRLKNYSRRPRMTTKHDRFRNSFIPYALAHWQ